MKLTNTLAALGIGIAFALSFGFVIPSLLSAPDDFSALGGIALTLAWALAALYGGYALINKLFK